MAYLQMNFMSEALMRTVTVNVILPLDKISMPGMPQPRYSELKTMYLLHGIFGNHTDWVNSTSIQRLAEEKNIAVVMPAGENMFYIDHETDHRMYGDFIGRELVEVTRRMFPLSHRQEDTFIAGLSMGGYGALRNGLKYTGTFGKIAALSAALIIDGIENRTNDVPFFIERRDYAEAVFGELGKVNESDKNPLWMLRKLKETGKKLPGIYMACGLEDSLYPVNRKYAGLFKNEGADITFEDAHGGHDWDFWGHYIKNVFEWLEPENEDRGSINSGNIGI